MLTGLYLGNPSGQDLPTFNTARARFFTGTADDYHFSWLLQPTLIDGDIQFHFAATAPHLDFVSEQAFSSAARPMVLDHTFCINHWFWSTYILGKHKLIFDFISLINEMQLILLAQMLIVAFVWLVSPIILLIPN